MCEEGIISDLTSSSRVSNPEREHANNSDALAVSLPIDLVSSPGCNSDVKHPNTSDAFTVSLPINLVSSPAEDVHIDKSDNCPLTQPPLSNDKSFTVSRPSNH